jgi:GT2 family glycosyltransferase
MATTRLLISILNWNKAETTLACVESLLGIERHDIDVDILVIDNGSEEADYRRLSDSICKTGIQVRRMEKNLGFTGGHNESLKIAIKENYDFVWMLNNDTIVPSETLMKLVKDISADNRCGAVSPVIVPDDGSDPENAWGLTHDWAKRGAIWMQSEAASKELHLAHPEGICLPGTAILLRVQAIREVGLLDERLFAYYDDNDIGTRLSNGGWRSKIVFDAVVKHGASPHAERPLYFSYLMFRNELIFWYTNMPQKFRKLLWLKLVNQSLFNVQRLRRRGMQRHADSALLGVWDFVSGRFGVPKLGRKPPLVFRLIAAISGYLHKKQLSST